MPSHLVTTGLERLDARLKALGQVDFAPLMAEWEEILTEDNRQGLLAGIDGFGKKMRLTWRNRHRDSQWVTRTEGGKQVRFKMVGSDEGGDGPPLVPHWEASRAIANFRTAHGHESGGSSGGRFLRTQWWAIGAWEDVVSASGVQFLPFHFRGEGRLPRRDLAHVRPRALKAARAALRDFAEDLLKGP